MIRIPGMSRLVVPERTWPLVLDLGVFCAVFGVFCGVLSIAHYWLGAATPVSDISRSPRALPLYAFYSLVRIGLAYGLSLVFAVSYGYIAYYNPRVQGIMISILDILQSIPVLSFLPGVMLAMVALFPTRQIGVELGAIVLIFTGQVWNMAFSFYSSLQSIPRELREAATIYGFSKWQRFFHLELPYATIGLVWNSMVSVAGAWFFLMACEMFVLGKRDFRLPGLGSYLQMAASAGDTESMLWGLGTMIGVIVLLDFVVWRPVIAWADKFKFEQVESAAAPSSIVLRMLRSSRALAALHRKLIDPLAERAVLRFRRDPNQEEKAPSPARQKAISLVALVVVAVIAVYSVVQAVLLIRGVSGSEWRGTFRGAGASFLRVNVSLLIAALWTVPVGVAIGLNRKLAQVAQPIAQIAASVPATALFPVVLLALIRVGGGLGVGSILLMLLGTQWYILFNVIAGATAIPTDLREVSELFRFDNFYRWRIVILPGIFPYLVTGMVTASGGAWNASIVAEYFHFKDQILSTVGLGAQISSASDSGRFDLLLLSTIVMAAMVVCMNRLVWRRMYRLAETRYRLET
jgi:NitT/TauT family transport system permease protein